MATRFSKVDKLPPELLALVAKLRTEDKCTIEEILAKLAELRGGDPGISLSGLARHTKEIDDIAKMVLETGNAARDILGRLGDKPESDSAKLVGEMLKTIMFKLSAAALKSGGDPDIAIKDVRSLADGLYRVASAQKVDADRILKVRKETAQAAVKEVEKIAAKTPGLSRDTVDEIKRQVLGLAK